MFLGWESGLNFPFKNDVYELGEGCVTEADLQCASFYIFCKSMIDKL